MIMSENKVHKVLQMMHESMKRRVESVGGADCRVGR